MKKIFLGLLIVFISFSTEMFAQEYVSPTYKQWVTKSADFMEQNQLDSAEHALNQAIMSDPENKNNSWLMTSLGTIQQRLGKFDAAYISLTTALNKHPESVFILHQRADLLKDMERLDEARSDYNSILAIDSLDIEALYNRGVLKLEMKDMEGAKEDFELAEENGEFSPYGMLGKALLHRLNDDWAEAEKVYTTILDEYPEMTELYLKRAECYLHLDELSKLSADLQKVSSTEFANPTFYFLRGQLRLKEYDKVAAKDDFKRAEELGMDTDLLEPWMEKTK